jgi:phage baseplate assembly protein W
MAAPLQRYFFGFSTQNSSKTGVRTLYDIDLINVDLMNAFQTRVGERVMRPDYGCKLWDYLMEPFTEAMRDMIIVEAIRICELDSRLTIVNIQVFEYEQGFRIEITLNYQPWNVIDTFTTSFQRDDLVYFGANSN